MNTHTSRFIETFNVNWSFVLHRKGSLSVSRKQQNTHKKSTSNECTAAAATATTKVACSNIKYYTQKAGNWLVMFLIGFVLFTVFAVVVVGIFDCAYVCARASLQNHSGGALRPKACEQNFSRSAATEASGHAKIWMEIETNHRNNSRNQSLGFLLMRPMNVIPSI